MKPEGRRVAVRNLLDRCIDRLVIIGGDGSLTGAYYLSKEWADHVAAIVKERQEQRRQTVHDEAKCKYYFELCDLYYYSKGTRS
jgi:6-phosphofructokinase